MDPSSRYEVVKYLKIYVQTENDGGDIRSVDLKKCETCEVEIQ